MTQVLNVLVTRPEHQAEKLCQQIEKQGWNAIRFPTIKIEGVDNSKFNQQMNRSIRYQWVIFISANAVQFALQKRQKFLKLIGSAYVAAIGKATRNALFENELKVDLLPATQSNTEGLLATKEMNQVAGQAVLIVRGKAGRETLAKELVNRGAQVDYMQVYDRVLAEQDGELIEQMLAKNKLHVITITSVEALMNLMKMVNRAFHQQLTKVALVVFSERIKNAAEELQFKQIVVTDTMSDEALVESISKIH